MSHKDINTLCLCPMPNQIVFVFNKIVFVFWIFCVLWSHKGLSTEFIRTLRRCLTKTSILCVLCPDGFRLHQSYTQSECVLLNYLCSLASKGPEFIKTLRWRPQKGILTLCFDVRLQKSLLQLIGIVPTELYPIRVTCVNIQ